ncbi:hypothetical protein OGH69_07260 [Flavobacterium sp. MFBS3-15]|uniref:hypothetical protein n=1 Tax=Flavobacterium sp. MFBS3-15 TaxID=2989816 RepID=UPI0022361457|nr:hypothetical protein [Flavobacterium sp. MFBS3-15]MCW4468753.1 hypothetical protein [Flavobacterium sp. MFBS3-15]
MKIKLLGLIMMAFLCVGKFFAQDSIPSVEKSIKGIQVGESGLVFNYEFKLANQFSLRTEAGLTLAFFTYKDNPWTISDEGKTYVVALPAFTVEPRWYYNLGRRVRKGKDIIRNRANYFSLMAHYSGGWGAINPNENIDEVPDFLAIIPTWGMRRTLGNHFNYELGAGLGYMYTSKYNDFGYSHKSEGEMVVYVRARFGFDF